MPTGTTQAGSRRRHKAHNARHHLPTAEPGKGLMNGWRQLTSLLADILVFPAQEMVFPFHGSPVPLFCAARTLCPLLLPARYSCLCPVVAWVFSKTQKKERAMQERLGEMIGSYSGRKLGKVFVRAMRAASYVSVIVLPLCLGVGCTSTVKARWEAPALGSPSTGMTVPVAKIQDRRGGNLANTDVVGKHTFTLFAIPVSDIRADSYLDESLYSLISDALAAAGYQTSKAKEGCGCEAPLKLVPELSKLNYWSYMWFWPLMFEGGGVDLRVRLVDADGNTLWRSSGDAGSFWLTPFGAWGFESALNGDLSKTAEELADEFRTPAFRQALEGSPAVPVQGTGH